MTQCYIKVGKHGHVTKSNFETLKGCLLIYDVEVTRNYFETIVSIPMDLEFYTRIEAESIRNFLEGQGITDVTIVEIGG